MWPSGESAIPPDNAECVPTGAHFGDLRFLSALQIEPEERDFVSWKRVVQTSAIRDGYVSQPTVSWTALTSLPSGRIR